jgi:hypothetical protein
MIAPSPWKDFFTVAIGLFAAILGGTANKFYPYQSSSNAKPPDIPVWLGRSFFIAIGMFFVVLGLLDLSGLITLNWKGSH